MDKVYKKYKEAKMNPQKLMDELGIDITTADQGDNLGMGVVRKETDLNNEEKQFLLAVERGDIPTARHFLEESQIYFNININCVDPLGRTALLIAIENDNIELMEVLLAFNVEAGDSLLHAISEENVEAVEMLLHYQSNNKKDLSGFLGGVPSSSFTPDITPIILAAHRDNYEIIKILLDRGDRIPKPHDVRCSCADCVTKNNEDSLNHSRSRINAYRALASPSLTALSSKDPILTAFELSWELKRLSRLENEFKTDYEALAKQTQNFSVALLDQTRGSKELETILNHDASGPPGEGMERMNLARLKLAIKYKQKKFVSHANCQQLLASLWYEGLPGFRRKHIIFKVILTVSVCLMYPILSLLYLVAPKSSLGRFMRQPFIKFICHSASYMTFLFLLILASQRIDSVINFGGENEKMNREIRGAQPTSIEWMILAYVAGLVWSEVKQLWDDGARVYIQDMWNILDFITNSLYIATFTLKLVAYLRVQQEIVDKNPAAYATRDQWDAFDPNLISEGLFATANIFSSLKLIYIFTINPHLGPLQISLGRMINDIIKFAFIAVLVVFSYACGVNQLYWYYAAARQADCEACEKEVEAGIKEAIECECDRTLANLFEILQTLYFAIFGLVDVKHFELRENHQFTQYVGKTMYGSYSCIMIIVLLNMLIAMLSNSYQLILNDADTEWKFARSKLWMSYFEEGGTMPQPFNIIPSPKTIWYVVLWFKDKLCRCSKRHKRSKWQSIRKLVKHANEREARYQSVMRDLVKRYIMQQQRGEKTEGVTEDDLNEIKQDISSFRYELLEILKNNGMKLPHYDKKPKQNQRLKRKGSRMSMERLARMNNIEPIPEQSYEMPKFLEQQDSAGSNGSTTGLSALGQLARRAREMEKKKGEGDKQDSPNSKRDEGLGESFDQQSEMSDSSLSSKTGNGVKNSVYDTVPEERISESGSLKEDAGSIGSKENENNSNSGCKEAVSPDSGNDELPLDASKLETEAESSPFGNKKLGATKKVSFLWGGENEDKQDSTEPVSQTYVYDGKALESAKFKFGSKRRGKRK